MGQTLKTITTESLGDSSLFLEFTPALMDQIAENITVNKSRFHKRKLVNLLRW